MNNVIKNLFERLHKGTVVALCFVLAGISFSCAKNDRLDYSNIENLYEQPLPVIQKCVQGKWKWYVMCGGVVGCQYSDNTFVDIYNDHVVIDYDDGSQRTFYFTWKKRFIHNNKYGTYVMWDSERNDLLWHFVSIRNDTLIVGHSPEQFSTTFVRIK